MKCRLFQIWINWRLDDGRPLPDAALRHLASCPRCSVALRNHQVAETALRQSPAPPNPPPSPWLTGRIMSEVQKEEPVRHPPFVVRALPAMAALIVITLFVLFRHLPTQGPGGPPSQSASAPEPLRIEWLEATARLTDGPGAWLGSTNVNDPLQQELELVLGDARSALSSLKKEFIPSQLLAVNDPTDIE
ncbi:MAG TPA: hypothetical protein DCY13_06445 [Verrucomicrobiales bacterium]|nr:hypothetical protein [Verrucomicrobiales bacterium]